MSLILHVKNLSAFDFLLIKNYRCIELKYLKYIREDNYHMAYLRVIYAYIWPLSLTFHPSTLKCSRLFECTYTVNKYGVEKKYIYTGGQLQISNQSICQKRAHTTYLCTWTCAFGKHLCETASTMCFSKHVSESALEDGTVLLSQFIDIWLKSECSQ